MGLSTHRYTPILQLSIGRNRIITISPSFHLQERDIVACCPLCLIIIPMIYHTMIAAA